MKKNFDVTNNDNKDDAIIEKLNTQISTVKTDNKLLKEDISALNLHDKDYKEFQNARIEKLKNKHTVSKEYLLKENEKLNKTLVSSEKKVNTLQDSLNKKNTQLEAKKDRLKKNIINKYNTSLDKDLSNTETLRLSYEKQLNDLKDLKDKQLKEFNLKASNLDKESNATIGALKQESEALHNKLEELKEGNNSKINSLEIEISNAKNKASDAINQKENDYRTSLEQITKTKVDIINAKKEELLSLEKTYDNLSFKKEQLLKKQKDLSDNAELEYRRLENKYDNEISLLINENERIKNLIIAKNNEEASIRTKIEDDYKKTLAEINELSQIFKDNEKKTLEEFEDELNKKSIEFKEHYSALVAGFDKKYQNEKDNNEKQLEVLKQKVEIEKKEYEKRKTYLLDRYNDRFKQAQQTIERLKNDNHELEDKYRLLSNEYNQKTASLNSEIKAIDTQLSNQLEEKEKEYNQKIVDYQKENDAIIEDIQNDKAKVNDQIDELNKKIIGIQADIDSFDIDFDAEKQKLNSEFVAEKQRINDNIKALQDEIHTLVNDTAIKTRNENEKKLSDLIAKKEEINSKHIISIDEIETNFKNKMQELENSHQNEMEKVQKLSEQKLAGLISHYQQQINSLILEEEAVKITFENEKARINTDSIELEDKYKADVAKLQSARSDLLIGIQAQKDKMNAEQATFKNKLNELSINKTASLDALREEYENKKAEIASAFLNRKKDEEMALSQLRITNDEKEADLNTLLSTIEKKKSEREETIANFNKEFTNAKASLLDKLDEEKENLKKLEESHKEQLDLYDKKLSDKKKEIEDLKQTLNDELISLKNNNDDGIKKIMIFYKEELQKKMADLKNHEESIVQENELEISNKEKELELLKEKCANILNGIKNSKEKLKNEYINSYNLQLKRTKQSQEELNEAENDLVLNRGKWQILLENKQKENELDLELVKKNYDKDLEQLKTDNKAIIDNLLNNKQVLIEDSNRLMEQCQQANRDYDAYVDEQNIKFDELKNKTSLYINNLKKEIAIIADKQNEYNEVFAKKVVDIKKDLVNAFDTYEELVRVRPFVLKNEDDQKEDIMLILAAEFKEKIEELNKNHQEAIALLNDYKNDKLIQIEKEFEENVNLKGSLDQTYESEMKQISDKYEMLIANEKEKQNDLRYKIDLSIKNINEEEALYQQRLEELQVKLNEDKKLLEKVHFENLNKEKETFELNKTDELNQTSHIKDDIELINKKIEEINHKYNVIDDEIYMKRFAILTVFENKMQEIDDYYNSLVNDDKNRRKQVDLLSNSVASVFKKN